MANDLILYGATDGEGDIVLPHRWEICSRCGGEGKSCAYLGAFTREDFDEDPDFADDYFGGAYDRACDCCGGAGKIKVADRSKMTKAQRKAWDAQEQEDRDMDAINRAERDAECWAAGGRW